MTPRAPSQLQPAAVTPARRLGVAERAMWSLEKRRGAGHLVRIIEIDGFVSADALREALARVCDHHPLLRVTIEEDGRTGSPRFVMVPGAIEMRYEEVDDAGSAARSLAQRALRAVCWPPDRPLIRAHAVAEPRRGRTALVITCHHAIADGRSLNRLCQELVALCRGTGTRQATVPQARRHGLPPPAEEVLFGSVPSPRVMKLVEEFVESEAQKVATREFVDIPYDREGVPARSSLLHVRLPGEFVVALERYRRTTRRSVHAVLAGVTLRAIRHVWFQNEPRVHLPLVSTVDLRSSTRFTALRSHLALYMSGLRTVIPVNADGSVEDSVVELERRFGDHRFHAEAELAVLLQAHAVDYHLARCVPPGVATLSNLGRVEFASTLLRPVVTAIHGAVPMHALGPTLYNHVVAMRRELVWNVVFPEPWIARPNARKFVERLSVELAEHLGLPPSVLARMDPYDCATPTLERDPWLETAHG